MLEHPSHSPGLLNAFQLWLLPGPDAPCPLLSSLLLLQPGTWPYVSIEFSYTEGRETTLKNLGSGGKFARGPRPLGGDLGTSFVTSPGLISLLRKDDRTVCHLCSLLTLWF